MNSKSDFVKTSLQWSIRVAIYLRHKAGAQARTPEDPETPSEVTGQSEAVMLNRHPFSTGALRGAGAQI